MGIACGDLDGDGRPDLAVTNFYGESTSFFRNLGAGQFIDNAVTIGLAAPSTLSAGLWDCISRCRQRWPARSGAGERTRH